MTTIGARRDGTDRREVLRLVAGVGRQREPGREHHQRIAVRRRLRGSARADHGARAGTVFDDDLLTERDGKFRRHHARDGVDTAAGRIRNDQGDRTRGIVVRKGVSGGKEESKRKQNGGNDSRGSHLRLPDLRGSLVPRQTVRQGAR